MPAPKRYADPLEALLGKAMGDGAAVLARLARAAVARLLEAPTPHAALRLFSDEEREQLARELSAVTATAHLLGRSLVADHGSRVRRRKQVRVRESAGPPVLDVPVVLQDTNYTCGAACLQAVLAYHGAVADEGELATLLGTSPATGTTPEALARLARGLGLETEARAGSSLDDLAWALRHNAPLLCAVQRDGGGHWVVVAGVDPEDAGRGVRCVTLMDPLVGLARVKASDFEAAWWDTAAGRRYDRFALAIGAALREARLHRVLEAAAPVQALAPEDALAFFRSLVPVLGTDPQLLPSLQRTAFTLAAATEQELLQAVQGAILQRLTSGEVGTGKAAVQAVLDAAGVGTSPQYAETVFRTNAMDSYSNGTHEQLQREAATFPVWRYSNPQDSRSRPRHADLHGNYYPARASLDQVRGANLADKANCRCVQIPIDKWEWADLRAAGARIADGWPDVPAV